MSERETKAPNLSEQGGARRREREARLAEALRENLRKRKDQARGRAVDDRDGRDTGET